MGFWTPRDAIKKSKALQNFYNITNKKKEILNHDDHNIIYYSTNNGQRLCPRSS